MVNEFVMCLSQAVEYALPRLDIRAEYINVSPTPIEGELLRNGLPRDVGQCGLSGAGDERKAI